MEIIEGLSIAETSFVHAVAESLQIQDEFAPFQARLHGALARAAHANEAVLKELGITDQTPIEEALALQRKYMELAIEHSGLGEDNPVVQSVRHRADEADEVYRVMADANDAHLGQTGGPSL